MKIKVITYFQENDIEFGYDYVAIAAFNEKGEQIAYYGDSYHEKGYERMEGFLDGLKYAFGDLSIEKAKENTSDYY